MLCLLHCNSIHVFRISNYTPRGSKATLKRMEEMGHSCYDLDINICKDEEQVLINHLWYRCWLEPINQKYKRLGKIKISQNLLTKLYTFPPKNSKTFWKKWWVLNTVFCVRARTSFKNLILSDFWQSSLNSVGAECTTVGRTNCNLWSKVLLKTFSFLKETGL